MSEHKALIHWQNTGGADFPKGKYSREHTWTFDGGTVLKASASPSVVPIPYANPALVDPEEAFVAAVSSCHMLTFVFLAGRKGFVVESYTDNAVGHMTKDEKGVAWISSIELDPLSSTAEQSFRRRLRRKYCITTRMNNASLQTRFERK